MPLVKAQVLIREDMLSWEPLWKSRSACRFLKNHELVDESDL